MSQAYFNVPYLNTYWVVHSRFLAGEHPAELDDNATIARLTALLDGGIRAFVDLTMPSEIKSYHQLLCTLAETRRVEITFRRFPIPDRGVPSVSTLTSILDEIDGSARDQKPVFVHCFAGIGRTGTVVGCYLRRHRLAIKGEVVAQIARLRSLMPGVHSPSPQTSDQVRMVENWEDAA